MQGQHCERHASGGVSSGASLPPLTRAVDGACGAVPNGAVTRRQSDHSSRCTCALHSRQRADAIPCAHRTRATRVTRGTRHATSATVRAAHLQRCHAAVLALPSPLPHTRPFTAPPAPPTRSLPTLPIPCARGPARLRAAQRPTPSPVAAASSLAVARSLASAVLLARLAAAGRIFHRGAAAAGASGRDGPVIG